MNDSLEIKETGKLYDIDDKGFILCDCKESNIQNKWLEVIDYIISKYNDNYKDEIHSIYVRGSVATGEAVDNISDIDLIVLVKNDNFDTINFDDVKIKYPFVYKLDIRYEYVSDVLYNTNKIKSIDVLRFVIKHHSVCVYGDNIQEDISRYKFDSYFLKTHSSDMMSYLKSIKNNIFESNINTDTFSKGMSWVSKRIIRSGYQLVRDDLNVYTRDLYQCYKLFSKFYPDKENQMKMVLKKAIFPTNNVDDILEILKVGDWLTNKLEEREQND